MNPYPDDTFLARWLSGELTKAEQEAFEASEDYARLTRMLAGMDSLAVTPLDHQRLRSKIDGQLLLLRKQRAHRRSQIRWAIAAALALSLAGAWLWNSFQEAAPQMLSLQTQRGEQQTLILKDGSQVSLNAESKLTGSVSGNEGTRTFNLEGEAYFEVEKGGPFSVETAMGNIQVLGTHFTVFARDSLMWVSCTEGKVWVQTSLGGGVSDTLAAGEEAVYRRAVHQRRAIESTPPNWLSGKTRLRGSSLGEVIAEIERQYKLDIEVEGTDMSRPVSVTFPHDALSIALESAFAGAVQIDTLGPSHIRVSPLK